MANVFKCDVCGKETHLNPPTEPIMEEVEIEVEETFVEEYPVEVKENGKTVKVMKKRPATRKVKKTVKKQKTVKVKSMDFNTGQIVEREVGATRDLKPRCYIVKLNAGPVQTIQRDFCEEHYKDFVKHVNALWGAMEKIEVK